MAGVTKVNGHVQEAQFIGREVLGITLTGLVACPAAVDGKIIWPELNAAIQAVQTICSVTIVGVTTPTATVCNVIVEGHDFNEDAAEIVRLSDLVAGATAGGTAVAFAI